MEKDAESSWLTIGKSMDDNRFDEIMEEEVDKLVEKIETEGIKSVSEYMLVYMVDNVGDQNIGIVDVSLFPEDPEDQKMALFAVAKALVDSGMLPVSIFWIHTSELTREVDGDKMKSNAVAVVGYTVDGRVNTGFVQLDENGALNDVTLVKFSELGDDERIDSIMLSYLFRAIKYVHSQDSKVDFSALDSDGKLAENLFRKAIGDGDK